MKEGNSNFMWSNDFAYAIGLIATDGNLSSDKRHIQFTTTNYQLARNFKKCLNITNKISKTPPSGFGRKIAYRINFGNVKLYKRLERIGLQANKTYSLGKLRIPKRYFVDFLRGHLDGDGSVFTYVDKYMEYKGKRYTYNRLYTVFLSTSAEHLKWIQTNIKKLINIKGEFTSYLKKDRKIPIWRLRFAKNDSLKILPWIYYRPNLPCLSRKRKIAERFLNKAFPCKTIRV